VYATREIAKPALEEKASSLRSGPLQLRHRYQLGKYRLQKCLGKGGYCEVWKARDCVEGIWVALKIPQIGVNGQRDNESILREIRLVSQLRHPHIMPVKNADIIEGHAVLATDLSVATLADRSKPMAARRILSIIAQVLDGLAYAHRNRLVHCDVTPGNIFLFPNGRAALGDFGISFQFKGRVGTIDEYGTPGYVAPEQAYGRPTYRSDCFAVGLVLYEYLTGVLARWPFSWPLRGHQKLIKRASPAMVRFVKKALAVEPAKRFGSAAEMLDAMLEAAGGDLVKGYIPARSKKKRTDWRQMRSKAFVKRYGRVLGNVLPCVDCGEPIAESMLICPWCGSGRNRFDSTTSFTHICPRCHKGVLPEWRYCPWCYGEGFDSPSPVRSKNVRYQSRCKYCGGKLMRFMRYCPWCHRKVSQSWHVRPFPEICSRCNWPVDSAFWNYCPWCKQNLAS